MEIMVLSRGNIKLKKREMFGNLVHLTHNILYTDKSNFKQVYTYKFP